jgi:hypothetical protein
MPVSCLAYSSALKMEATCFFETTVDLQRTTQCYISEDGIFRNHFCEDLRPYNYFKMRSTMRPTSVQPEFRRTNFHKAAF